MCAAGVNDDRCLRIAPRFEQIEQVQAVTSVTGSRISNFVAPQWQLPLMIVMSPAP